MKKSLIIAAGLLLTSTAFAGAFDGVWSEPSNPGTYSLLYTKNSQILWVDIQPTSGLMGNWQQTRMITLTGPTTASLTPASLIGGVPRCLGSASVSIDPTGMIISMLVTAVNPAIGATGCPVVGSTVTWNRVL